MARLLRLGVLLNRGRLPDELPELQLTLEQPEVMILEISGAWLEEHPLTAADLEQEVELLDTVNYELRIVTT